MDTDARVTAEAVGDAAFQDGLDRNAVERFARERYNSVLLQNCVVSGWSAAYWRKQQYEGYLNEFQKSEA